MARIFTEDFERGINGGTATPTNTGFDPINGTAPTFTNVNPYVGSLAALFLIGGSSNSQQLQIPTATIGTRSTLGISMYVRLETLPGSNLYIASTNSSGTARASLRINPDGSVACRNGVTAVHTSTFKLATATQYRIEWLISGSSQAFRIYAGHGTTPLYDSGSQTYNSGTFNNAIVGIPIAGTNQGYRMGWVALDGATWPGPAVTAAAPTVNAGADQVGREPFIEVTLSGTVSGSNITSRAWTQTAGTPVTLSGSSTNTATFTSPGSIAGETLTFQFAATNGDGMTGTDTVNVTVLPVTERCIVDGAWAPMQLRTLP